MRTTIHAAGALAALGGILAASGGAHAAELRLRPDDAALVARGAGLYAEHCAACHGAALEGQPDWRERGPDGRLPAPPHDETGHTWHHDGPALHGLVKFGVAEAVGLDGYESDMPAYGGILDDEEILAVLSYIKSTWPADVRAMHDEIEERSR